MEPTWEGLDRPVLAAAVQYIEDHNWERMPQAYDLAPIVGATAEEVGKALLRLEGEYVEVFRSMGGLAQVGVNKVHAAARQAIGQWPSPADLADGLIAELQVAADAEPDGDKRSKLKQTAVFLGSSGKDLFVNLVASVIARSAGLG